MSLPLRGGNGRHAAGKRNFRIRFNDGRFLWPRTWWPAYRRSGTAEYQCGPEQSRYAELLLNEALCYDCSTSGVPRPIRTSSTGVVSRNRNRRAITWAISTHGVGAGGLQSGFLESHTAQRQSLQTVDAARAAGLWDGGHDETAAVPGAFAVTTAATREHPGQTHRTAHPRHGLAAANVNYSNCIATIDCRSGAHYDFWPIAQECGCTSSHLYGQQQFHGRSGCCLDTTIPGGHWNSGQDSSITHLPCTGPGRYGYNLELQKECYNVMREVRDC